jgi:hypothetical protein
VVRCRIKPARAVIVAFIGLTSGPRVYTGLVPPAAPCPEPHPLRGPDGLQAFDSYEAMGRAGSDDWGRCRACGRWFWFSTDIGGKYEYVGQKEIEVSLAERAFLGRDLDAVVAIFLRYELPFGPVWQLDQARVELIKQLAPGRSDSEVAAALAAAPSQSPWARVRDILLARAKADRATIAARPISFQLDIEMDRAGIEDLFELPGAVALYRTEPPFEVIRLDATGTAVRILLPARPRLLARDERRALWAIEGQAGDIVLTLGEDGAAHVFPEVAERYLVESMDDGFWWFAPQGEAGPAWVEIRRPDATEAAKLLMPRRAGGSWYPPPPRRMDGGWVASGGLDLNGDVVSISLYDEGFQLVARSDGAGEGRLLTPVDNEVVLASPLRAPFGLERWSRDGSQFKRDWSREARGFVLAGESLAALVRGALKGFDLEGRERFSVPTGDALYLVSAGDLAVAYGQSGAVIADVRTGEVLKRLRLRMSGGVPDLLQDKTGAIYLRDDRHLHILRGRSTARVDLPFEASLLTTSGDAALLGDTERGRYLLVGADGILRGGFEADGARFSVVGTRAGPYVLEPRRLRIHAFWNGSPPAPQP